MEQHEREASDLRSQLSKILNDMSGLQEQHSCLKLAGAAREQQLLERCGELEARLQAAEAQNSAAAAELIKSRSDTTEVRPTHDAGPAAKVPCALLVPVQTLGK